MSKLYIPRSTIIPGWMILNKKICPDAKIFFGVLNGLAKSKGRTHGVVYGSDENFAELMEVSVRTIQRWLVSLEKENALIRDTNTVPHKNKDTTKKKKFDWSKERKIYISDDVSKISYEHDKSGEYNEHDKSGEYNEHDKSGGYKDISLQDEKDISKALYDSIIEWKGSLRSRHETWTKDFSRLMKPDKDGNSITKEQIMEIIEWLPSNEFWRKNILSGKKFREQFDKLDAEMKSDKKPNGKNNNNDKTELMQAFGLT